MLFSKIFSYFLIFSIILLSCKYHKNKTCIDVDSNQLIDISFQGNKKTFYIPKNAIIEKDTLQNGKYSLYFSSDSLLNKTTSFVSEAPNFYSINISFFTELYSKEKIKKELSFSKKHNPLYKKSSFKFISNKIMEGYEYETNNSYCFRGKISNLNIFVSSFSFNKEHTKELYLKSICVLSEGIYSPVYKN